MARIPLALLLLAVATLTACASCGDAPICPSSPSEDFPASAVPLVRMHGDSVQFEAPPSTQRYRHYALQRVYVYEVIGERVVWKIDSKTRGLQVKEMPQYDPQSPLLYGQLVEGTALTVPPTPLQPGKDYNMRADLIGYDQPSVLSSEHLKVTFRLKRDNGQLRVEQLPTRRAD